MKRRFHLALLGLMAVSFILGLIFLLYGLLLNNELALNIGVFLAVFFAVSCVAYLEEKFFSFKEPEKYG